MIRRKLLMTVVVCLVGLLAAGIFSSVKKDSEVRVVVAELDSLAAATIERIGDTPDSVKAATAFLNERRDGIKAKIETLRTAGLLKPGSEELQELEASHENNKSRFAEVYDRFVAKAYQDIDRQTQATQKRIRLSSRPSSPEFRAAENEIEQISRINERNLDMMNALDALVAGYRSILEVD